MSRENSERPRREEGNLGRKYPLLSALLNAPPKRSFQGGNNEGPSGANADVNNQGNPAMENTGSSRAGSRNPYITDAEMQDLVAASIRIREAVEAAFFPSGN